MIKSIALLAPIFVSLFWSLNFLLREEESFIHKSRRYLALLMLCTFFLYICHAVFFNNFFSLYSYIESIYVFTMLSIYPLFYIYLLALASEKINRTKYFLFFTPALLCALLTIICTMSLNKNEHIFYVQEILIARNLKDLDFASLTGIRGGVFFTSRLLFFIQVLYFAFYGIRLIKKHDRRIGNYYSNIEGKTLNWARQMYIAILWVAFSSAALTLIGRSYFVHHELTLVIPSVIFTTFLFILGFKGNQQIQVNEILEDEQELLLKFEEIKATQPELLKIQLIQLFEKKNIFKQPDLRITTVSEELGTNRTYISRLINEEFDMNFNEFVNKYRIQEAKALLKNRAHKDFTIEHVAEKSGFGSIASFSRAFKVLEGVTPGKYREKEINGNR